jgi:hypothetical protein
MNSFYRFFFSTLFCVSSITDSSGSSLSRLTRSLLLLLQIIHVDLQNSCHGHVEAYNILRADLRVKSMELSDNRKKRARIFLPLVFINDRHVHSS